MARLAPPGKTTQAFGLFALSGKVTSFAGPLAVALITWLSQSQRIGVSAIIAFFVAGTILIVRVAPPDRRGA
jgi:UMF1 family MFS transporter